MKRGRNVVLVLAMAVMPACKSHVTSNSTSAADQIKVAETIANDAAQDYWSNRACRHQNRADTLANKPKRAHARYRHANKAVALWRELHGGEALECAKPQTGEPNQPRSQSEADQPLEVGRL